MDIGYVFKDFAGKYLQPNLYLYHLHSIIRFICFSMFFVAIKKPDMPITSKIISIGSFLFVVINFLVSEEFFAKKSISSRLFAFEAAVLLFYCLQYFLYRLKQDTILKREADYWVVIGLSIYVAFNFPYFLIYKHFIDTGRAKFIEVMWHYHNVTFIILCIFIAKAFYDGRRR
jgi:hypothetical protein